MSKDGKKGGSSSHFWEYVIIVSFAAALIALGLHEINIRFAKKVSTDGSDKLIDSLHNDLRARLRPEQLPEPGAGAPGRRGAWGKEDQEGLQNLLNRVAP